MDSFAKAIVVLSCCVAAQCASAQTTVTTSGGTSGTVPVFSGNATVGNSSITSTGGKVGIGVSSPGVTLDVSVGAASIAEVRTTSSGPDAAISFKNSASGGREYWWDSGASGSGVGAGNFSIYDDTAGASRLTVTSSGNIGIGTITPDKPLEVNGGIHLNMPGINWSNNQSLLITNSIDTAAGDTGAQIWHGDSGAGGSHLLIFSGYPQTSAALTGGYMVLNTQTGNVGIGTTNPGAKLEVDGNLKLTAGSGGSITFPDATTQSTAWNGVLSGGDYAESVNVSGGREEYEPGDVLVIDATSEGNFLKSSAPYSAAVTGIYSTKPGVVGRRQLTARTHMKEEVPMAMTGIVPTKVSAENGPIRPGDLLVTSSTPGYAMKGTDRTKMLGAVIGKAIGHLDSGVGVIEAVVTLQ